MLTELLWNSMMSNMPAGVRDGDSRMEGGGENRLKTGVARARGERAVNTGGEEIRGVNWVGEWETGATLASDLASGGRAGGVMSADGTRPCSA